MRSFIQNYPIYTIQAPISFDNLLPFLPNVPNAGTDDNCLVPHLKYAAGAIEPPSSQRFWRRVKVGFPDHDLLRLALLYVNHFNPQTSTNFFMLLQRFVTRWFDPDGSFVTVRKRGLPEWVIKHINCMHPLSWLCSISAFIENVLTIIANLVVVCRTLCIETDETIIWSHTRFTTFSTNIQVTRCDYKPHHLLSTKRTNLRNDKLII